MTSKKLQTATIIEKPEGTEGKIIYHYTTQEGLLGIVSGHEIWATQIQYLNDASEFRSALALAEEYLKQLYVGKTNEIEKELISRLQDSLKGIAGVTVCVCSFSGEKDSLSQWRAYGGKFGGYAIGFSLERLQALAKGQGIALVQCIYEDSDKEWRIRKLITRVLSLNPESLPDNVPLEEYFIDQMYMLAPEFKHAAFKHEDEWRLITKPVSVDEENFAYRTGQSMIIPYYKFSLGKKENQPIETVVIGPTPNPQLAMESVHSLLMSKDLLVKELLYPGHEGYKSADQILSLSEIPYRGW